MGWSPVSVVAVEFAAVALVLLAAGAVLGGLVWRGLEDLRERVILSVLVGRVVGVKWPPGE